MQNDLNTRPPLDGRRSGIGGGTIAAIVAALVIVRALFVWGPWNTGSKSGTASNASSGTTTGSASTANPASPSPRH